MLSYSLMDTPIMTRNILSTSVNSTSITFITVMLKFKQKQYDLQQYL